MVRLVLLIAGVGLLTTGGHALLDASPPPIVTLSPADPPIPATGTTPLGTVEGVVRLEAVAPESPPILSPYARRRYRPPPTSARGQLTPENVVVFVPTEEPPVGPSDATSSSSPSGAGGPGSPPTAVITQRDRTIIPHVTAVPVGTRIDFPNEDDVFHNLFSLSDPGPFNLGRYPPGDSRSVIFDRPGVIRMFCDIHSEMTAVIRVMSTPHFTRPAADGSFRITGVPEGVRTVVAWHDQLGADTVQVRVSSSGARAELRLPR